MPWATALALCGAASLAAQDKPTLVILGAVEGQVKLLADTSRVSTTLTIESTSADRVTAVVRVGPFRDANGRLHTSTATVDSASAAAAVAAAAAVKKPAANAKPATGKPAGAPTGGTPASSAVTPPSPPLSTALPIALAAHGVAQLTIDATLQTEGEYTSEIVIVSGKRRDVARLVVTRAVRDLGVEIQGVDAAHGTATVGSASAGGVRLVLLEKIGRDVTLEPIQLTKLTRKNPGGAKEQQAYQLSIDGRDPQAVALKPNQSQPITLTLGGLDGAGDYAGTMRISAPGAKPVDQDFSLTLRESRLMAFFMILAGVVLSAFVRWLSQSFRPRLVETRRVHLLVRELDELLGDPTRDAAERDVLRLLRRETVAAQVALDTATLTIVKGRLDRLEARRPLAVEWMRRRRQVEALKPDALRDHFRPAVDAARDVVIDEHATTEQVADARKALAGLNAAIDKALRDELKARIASLRKSLDNVIATRASSQLALVAPGTLGPMLDEAEAHVDDNNLRAALTVYDKAQRAWTSFLLDDLALVAGGPAPTVVADADWTALATRLNTLLREARALLDEDPDAAIRRYHSAWAAYVATVSDGLRRAFDALRQKVQTDEELNDELRDAILATIGEGVTANTQARAAIAAARTQEAVGLLASATEHFTDAQRTATRRTRTRALERAGGPASARAAFPAAADLEFSLFGERADDDVGSETAIAGTTSTIDRIDVFIAIVSVIVATLLGMTMLWAPDATWGGWEDRIVAILWGLGFHQFTFTGLAGVTDRLRGTAPAGGQS